MESYWLILLSACHGQNKNRFKSALRVPSGPGINFAFNTGNAPGKEGAISVVEIQRNEEE